MSVEGVVVAASRLGDEERRFSFHAPDAGQIADELKAALVEAATPRDRPVPAVAGTADVLLARGCAAVLFHEILAHPLEADAERSPLSDAGDAPSPPPSSTCATTRGGSTSSEDTSATTRGWPRAPSS